MTVPISAYVLLPAFAILAIIFRRDLLALAVASAIFEAASILDVRFGGSVFSVPVWIPMLALSCLNLNGGRRFKSGRSAPKQTSLNKSAVLSMTIFFVYAGVSAFVMPFIFHGLPMVAGLTARTAGASTLKFGTMNLTQFGYLAMMAFIFYRCAFERSDETRAKIITFYVNACAFSALLGIYQVISQSKGWYFPSEILYSNATYKQSFGVEVSGLYRLNSTFAEASIASLFFAGSFGVMLGRCASPKPKLFDVLRCGLFALALVLSFSTTAFIVLVVGLGYFLLRLAKLSLRSHRAVSVGLVGLGLIVGLIIFASQSSLSPTVNKITTKMITEKGSSVSYNERHAVDVGGFELFFNTLGLGAGLGSFRASSLVAQLLATVGVIGFVAFGGCIAPMYFTKEKAADPSGLRPGTLLGLALMLVAMAAAIPDLVNPELWAFIGLLTRFNPLRRSRRLPNDNLQYMGRPYSMQGPSYEVTPALAGHKEI